MKTFMAGILVMAFVVVLSTGADGQTDSNDPCENVRCDRGRMCVAKSDVSTTCVCPESCSKEYDPVCSVYNRQFNNTCEMHRFACRYGFFTSVKNKGLCTDPEGTHCPIDQLLDFHERYLAWLLIAYKEESKVAKSKNINLGDITDDIRRKMIEYEFTSRDTNKDGHLDPSEIKVMVDEREPCMVALLKACDFDGESGISHDEWDTCFPSKLEELENEFVNEDL